MSEMKVYLSEKDMYKAWYEEAIARIAYLEEQLRWHPFSEENPRPYGTNIIVRVFSGQKYWLRLPDSPEPEKNVGDYKRARGCLAKEVKNE